MEIFNTVGGALLTFTAVFALGWGAHAFFHKRNHDKLKSRVSELESELDNAQQDQNVVVNINTLGRQNPEDIELSDDERDLLIQISEEGDCGPTEATSWNRQTLAGQRLREKGLIEEDQDGTHPTRLALEWLEQNNLLH